MNRPLSEVLRLVQARMELNGSAFASLDLCLTYGEITQIEHTCVNRIISRWSNTLTEHSLHNVTAKKISFKTLIRDTKQNESLSIR